MTFVQGTGDWTVVRTPTKASTTYTAGMLIYNDGTNDVPAATTTQQNIRGIALESKASTSATTHISIAAPRGADCTFYADMVSGETLAATDPGKPMDISSTALTVSTTSTYDTLTLVKYISSTQGMFKLNYTTGVEN